VLLAEQLDQPNELDPYAIRKALFYIVQFAPPERAAKTIIPIASNHDLDSKVRSDAVSALGLLPPKYADLTLASLLQNHSGIKESTILQALARAGDKTGLQALKALPPTSNSRLMALRAYAETMISLRLGEKPSATAERLAIPGATRFKLAAEDAKSLEKIVARVEGRPFDLDFSRELGFSFDCAGCKHVILFNAHIKRGAILEVADKRLIAGVVVMEDGATGRFVLRHSILLRPAKSKIRVSVLRTNGEVALAGELRASKNGFEMFLRDLGTEVQPMQIRAKISNDAIEMDAEAFSSVKKRKLTGSPLN